MKDREKKIVDAGKTKPGTCGKVSEADVKKRIGDRWKTRWKSRKRKRRRRRRMIRRRRKKKENGGSNGGREMDETGEEMMHKFHFWGKV